MAYIGNRPEQGNFRKCDAITTSATATYNLLVGGVAVNPNQNQCIVSLNGVIQSSGNSYTIASSQITFASALTSSDVIDFILILGDTLDVGTVSDDTIGLAQLSATGTASSSTYLRGDNSWATAGGDLSFGGDTFGADKTVGANDAYAFSLETSGNTAIKMDASGRVTQPLQPMCFVVGQNDATQTISNQTLTTIVFDTEAYDVGSNFNTTNYTFTAPVAGKYLCHLSISFNAGQLGTNTRNFMGLYVGGSAVNQNFGSPTGSNDRFSMYQTVVLDLSASATVTGRVYIDNGSSADVWMNSSGIDFTYMSIGLLG